MTNGSAAGTATGQTIGIDVGDTWSQICVVDAGGTVVEEARVRTTARAVHSRFGPGTPESGRPRGGDALALAPSAAGRAGP